MLSTVKRLNIPVMHSRKLWVENTGTVESLSLNPGLVSNDITNIDKRIKLIWIITNVVLPSGWGVAVGCTRSSSDSIVIEGIYMKYRNNIGGPIPPSNHIFLR